MYRQLIVLLSCGYVCVTGSDHKQKSVATVNMVALDAPTCLCSDVNAAKFGEGKGQLIYTPVADEPGGQDSKVPGAPATSLGFAKDCLPYPSGTMLLEENPSCDLRAYTGGQSCCHHMFTLLDKDQKTPWQDQFLTYRMKWRFWFQEVTPENTFVDVEQFNWCVPGLAYPAMRLCLSIGCVRRSLCCCPLPHSLFD